MPSRLWLVYGIVLACALVYWPASSSFAEVWATPGDNSYRHGPFIVIGCLWMLFNVRHQLAAVPAKPSRLALGLLLGASLLWVVTWHAAIRDLYLLLLPAIAWLTVVAAAGWGVGRTVGWAFAFLYMAAPAWGSVAPTLQTITAHVVDGLLPVFGVPSELDGTLVHIPAGVFDVAPGCSGLHYLTVGITIGLLVGELERASWRRRLLLVAVVAVLAMVSNWMRVLSIVIIGQHTQMQHPLVAQDHYWFGWVVFAVMQALFIWWARRTERAVSAGDEAPALRQESASPYVRAVSVAAVIPLVAYATSAAADVQSTPAQVQMSEAPDGWSGPFAVTTSDWQPAFVGADALQQGTYVDHSGRTVQMLVVFYRVQRQGRELVNYANSLLGPGLIEVSASVAQGPDRRFTETRATDRAGRQWLVWSEYESAGRSFAHPLYFQMWYGLNAVIGAPESHLYAYRVACGQSCDGARAALADFTRELRL